MEKTLLKVLQGHKIKPIPCWLMRQAGRYLPEYLRLREHEPDFLKFCLTPDLACEAMWQPLRRFDLDGSILFADILIVPHLMGQPVWFEKGVGPRLAPITCHDEVAALSTRGIKAKAAPICDTLQRMHQDLPKHITLIGFAAAPWTVAAYMLEGQTSRDFQKAKLFALTQPDAFAALIDKLHSATLSYLKAQIDAGAEVIQLFESWAATVPAIYMHEWVIKPTQRLVAALRQYAPQVPIIGFARGIGGLAGEYARTTGVQALNMDFSLSPQMAVDQLCPDIVLQGGPDATVLQAGGPALHKAVKHYLEVCSSYPYIFNLAHGILPTTPIDHVTSMLDQVKKYAG